MKEFSLAELVRDRSSWIISSMPCHAPSLVTTIAENGTVNVGAFEQTMLCSSEPPLIALSVSKDTDTLHHLRTHGECVIGFPNPAAAQQVYDAGVKLPRGVSELDIIGLTPEPARTVQPPRIAECWFSAEGTLAWEQDAGRHSVCGISIRHVALDARLWSEAPAERRRGLPMLYYAGNGAFFTPGPWTRLDRSARVTDHLTPPRQSFTSGGTTPT